MLFRLADHIPPHKASIFSYRRAFGFSPPLFFLVRLQRCARVKQPGLKTPRASLYTSALFHYNFFLFPSRGLHFREEYPDILFPLTDAQPYSSPNFSSFFCLSAFRAASLPLIFFSRCPLDLFICPALEPDARQVRWFAYPLGPALTSPLVELCFFLPSTFSELP